MADLSVYTDFDFHSELDWSGAKVTVTSTAVTVSKGDDIEIYRGNYIVTGDHFKGSVSSVSFETAGELQWVMKSPNLLFDNSLNVSLGVQKSYYLFNNDVVHSVGAGAMLDGFEGTNTASYDIAKSAVTANLTTGKATTAAGTDKLLNFTNLTGSAHADSLTGDASSNIIDGGKGGDKMAGGTGDDTYVVDSRSDTIVESRTGGIDTVPTSLSTKLGAHLENLVLTGNGSLSGIGNAGDNTITGNAGNNVLDGGKGADHFHGGLGNDTYIVDNVGDQVDDDADAFYHPGGGDDTIISSVNVYMPENIEHVVLTGAANLNVSDYTDTQANSPGATITGNSGDNRLDAGSQRIDTLSGGAGNDTYVINGVNPFVGKPYGFDHVIEKLGQGYDTVESDCGYTLPSNVEALVLRGGLNANGTGNSLANSLTGDDSGNLLDGRAGNDIMAGLHGNDRYVVDALGDQVIEVANGGDDSVSSSVSFRLGAFVEGLTLTGKAAIDGAGNNLDNTIVGNSGDNVIDGGAGADWLIGGAGNDVYIVDNVNDQVADEKGGIDSVLSSVSFSLLDLLSTANKIENLSLTGRANVNATGNGEDNVIKGNAGNNELSGGGGIDTVSYAGAHRVNADLSANKASGLNGTDSLYGFERIVGSSYDDKLAGDAFSNVLTGGAGDDQFIFNSARRADRVTDFHSGEDSLHIALADITIGDGDHVVEHARSVLGPNSFAAKDELVIVRGNIDGSINRDTAAAAIGHASGNYAKGDTALFVVDNGHDSSVYLFTAHNTDASVSANELTLIASLTGAASSSVADYVFGG